MQISKIKSGRNAPHVESSSRPGLDGQPQADIAPSTEFAHLRGILEARQLELENLLRNREVIAVHSNADMFDQIQQASERDMAVGNLERESVRLREVRGALERMHLGTFGVCLDCEEKISVKRLAALPWATLCIACREAADSNRTLAPDAFEAQFASVDQ